MTIEKMLLTQGHQQAVSRFYRIKLHVCVALGLLRTMRADDEVLIAHGLERPVAVPSHDYENDPPYVAVAREYRLTVGRGWLTGWTYDCYQHNARRLDAPECGLQLIANA